MFATIFLVNTVKSIIVSSPRDNSNRISKRPPPENTVFSGGGVFMLRDNQKQYENPWISYGN